MVGGYFNVILHEEEKLGGLPVFPREYDDFTLCINSCGRIDFNYKRVSFHMVEW